MWKYVWRIPPVENFSNKIFSNNIDPKEPTLKSEMLQMISEVAKSARGDTPRTLASLPSHDITPYARNAGMNVSQWIEQMEFRFMSLGIPKELWI